MGSGGQPSSQPGRKLPGGAARDPAGLRVLLVDDHAFYRSGLRSMLAGEGFAVMEAGSGAAAVALVASTPPDVVLMDLHMPVLNGIAATRRMRVEHPAVRVIALTTFDDDEEVFAALRAGAVGYLLKDVSSARLVEAVLAAARGESVLQPSVAAKLVARVATLPEPAVSAPVNPLSERELEVLRHLAEGRSNREIARVLFLSEGTVKNHVTSVLSKLGVRDRTQAALQAHRMGLL
jgi:DNA-binding NarL/FixJ family response regulator